MACVNVAHLLLARASAREGEFALRGALGASRAQALGPVLVEAVVVAALGGLAGTLVAQVLLATLSASVPDQLSLVSATMAGLDWRALAFTIGLATSTCLLVGVLPALRVGRIDVIDALKGRAPGVAGDGHERWHRLMVVAQLALVTTLMITAGLLLRSFTRLIGVAPGFDVERLLVAEVQFPDHYRSAGGSRQVMLELDRRLEAVPGVQGVTFSAGAPPRGGDISFDIHPEAEGGQVPSFAGIELPQLTVAPDYFATMRVPIVAGRGFEPADGDEAIIVNTVLARRIWGDVSPVGRRFRVDTGRPWRTVVGVAGDVKLAGLEDAFGEGMEAYHPYSASVGGGFYALSIRTSGEPTAMVRRLRDELKALDPLLPILEVSTMDERLVASVARPRFLLTLSWAFAILATIMAAVGVYGTTAYWVSRRQRELGVRMALGSSPAGLVRLVLGRGARLAVSAGAIGLGGALLLGGVLQSMLFETTPHEPVVLVATVGVLLTLVLAACAVPALRASRVDPARVLRSE